MKEQLDPIRKISAAKASEMAHSIFMRVGLQPLFFQLIYFAFNKDANDAEANLLLAELCDELMPTAECIFLNDYIASKPINDEKKACYINQEIIRRFYRCDLATHVSGTTEFDPAAFSESSQFVIDEKQLADLRDETARKGWTGELLFDSAVRLLGNRAGFLKHSSETCPSIFDCRNAEHFTYTEKWEEFLDARELFVDHSHGTAK